MTRKLKKSAIAVVEDCVFSNHPATVGDLRALCGVNPVMVGHCLTKLIRAGTVRRLDFGLYEPAVPKRQRFTAAK